MQFICAYLAWIYTDIEQWKIWCCCLHALFVQLGISERSIQVGSLIWSSFCFGRAWNKLCHSRVDVRWCESYPLSQGLEPNSVCDVRINCFHFSHIKRDSSSSNLHTPGLPNPGFTLDCPNMSHGQNTEWLGRIPKRRINQSAMNAWEPYQHFSLYKFLLETESCEHHYSIHFYDQLTAWRFPLH